MLLGACLTTILSFANSLSYTVNTFTEIVKGLTSVDRIHDFKNIPEQFKEDEWVKEHDPWKN